MVAPACRPMAVPPPARVFVFESLMMLPFAVGWVRRSGAARSGRQLTDVTEGVRLNGGAGGLVL